MSFRRLVEMCDSNIREEIGDFYFVSKSRMDNLISNLEQGAKRISELTEIIAKQQEQIKELQEQYVKEYLEASKQEERDEFQ